jgi:MFS family permease
MKGLFALLAFIALAMLSWGVYGPVLRVGQEGMDGSALRPFVCVGLAYFLIAVLAPVVMLRMFGEAGHWSTTGIVWSLAAGAAGAVGALGIILALAFRGSPLYVMPLVFGCAPVVNTFLTMYWNKSYKQAGPFFIAGLILVVVGAVTVMLSRPHGHALAEKIDIKVVEDASGVSVDVKKDDEATATHYQAASLAELQTTHPEAFKFYKQHQASAKLSGRELMFIILFTGMTALAWGVYGPTLHRGQMAMAGSRLRPLVCVGLAYFLIAVIMPTLMLTQWDEPGRFTFTGSVWSLLGGAAGALGALGIIMAFNFGGKPIFVMPLVFGGAPVINTFVSVLQAGNYDQLHPMFYAGLIVVVAGAVTVLVFAPKGGGHPAPQTAAAPAHEAAPA